MEDLPKDDVTNAAASRFRTLTGHYRAQTDPKKALQQRRSIQVTRRNGRKREKLKHRQEAWRQLKARHPELPDRLYDLIVRDCQSEEESDYDPTEDDATEIAAQPVVEGEDGVMPVPEATAESVASIDNASVVASSASPEEPNPEREIALHMWRRREVSKPSLPLN